MAIGVAALFLGGCAAPTPPPASELGTVAMLTFPSAGAGATPLSLVRAGPNGRWLVAPLDEEGLVAVFSSSGKLERMIGHRGEGPGEFGGIQDIVTVTEGHVIVFHPPRVTVLDSTLQHVIREFPRVAITSPRLLADSAFVSTRLLMPGQEGDPLVIFSPGFDSIGSVPDPFVDLRGDMVLRHVAVLDASRVLVSPVSVYSISVVDVGSRTSRVVPVDVARFPGGRLIDAPRGDPRTVRPSGRITAIGALTDSTAFIAYAVPKSTWEPDRAPAGVERRMPSVNEMGKLLDYFIEVIHLPSGESRLHQQLPAAINGTVGKGLGYSYTESALGEIGIRVVDVRVLMNRLD
jgi:hypothetical protein